MKGAISKLTESRDEYYAVVNDDYLITIMEEKALLLYALL